MLKLILIAAVVLLVSCAEDSPQSPLISIEQKGLLLELSTNKSEISLEELPEFTLKMINTTDSNLVLPLFLDGSTNSLRYPYTYFQVNGKKVETSEITKAGDGELEPLSPNNFLTLREGEMYMPDMHSLQSTLKEAMSKNGVYHISFVYCLESDNINDWGFNDDNDRTNASTRYLFERVPKETFASNVISISVVQ